MRSFLIYFSVFGVVYAKSEIEARGKATGDDGAKLDMHLSAGDEEGDRVGVLTDIADIVKAIEIFVAEHGGVFKGRVVDNEDALIAPAQYGGEAEREKKHGSDDERPLVAEDVGGDRDGREDDQDDAEDEEPERQMHIVLGVIFVVAFLDDLHVRCSFSSY